jgi:hypothetical protein
MAWNDTPRGRLLTGLLKNEPWWDADNIVLSLAHGLGPTNAGPIFVDERLTCLYDCARGYAFNGHHVVRAYRKTNLGFLQALYATSTDANRRAILTCLALEGYYREACELHKSLPFDCILLLRANVTLENWKLALATFPTAIVEVGHLSHDLRIEVLSYMDGHYLGGDQLIPGVALCDRLTRRYMALFVGLCDGYLAYRNGFFTGLRNRILGPSAYRRALDIAQRLPMELQWRLAMIMSLQRKPMPLGRVPNRLLAGDQHWMLQA